MVNRVIFYNYFHNGDLHVSRGLVKEVAKQCLAKGIPCYYYHNYSPEILSDIPGVVFSQDQFCSGFTPTHIKDDTLYLNTWYGSNQNVFNGHGLTFDTLYLSFKEAVKCLPINLESVAPIDMFPNIEYDKFFIQPAKNWLSSNSRRKVFISNGVPLSGQSSEFEFARIINRLADHYPNIDFLVSNEEKGLQKKPNVFLTRNIIQKTGCDLNENSYLSTFCDTIIGKFSGTYTYAMTKENYWDNPKKFIVYTIPTVDKVEWAYAFTPRPNAQIIRFGSSEENSVFKEITSVL